MSLTSQLLFRAALGNVARALTTPPIRADLKKPSSTLPVFRIFTASTGPLRSSLALLDSRDIVTTLYLAGVANQPVRREILSEFQRLVAAEFRDCARST